MKKHASAGVAKTPLWKQQGIDSNEFFETATPSSIRSVNRSIILYLIRKHQAISRAGLSELTGIYRSNVSFIVEELIAEGLVIEQRANPQGRGRVPILLSLHDEGHRVLAISIRPRYSVVAIAGLTGTIAASVTFDTPGDPALFLDALDTAIPGVSKKAGLKAQDKFEQVAISVPGFVNSKTGTISWLPLLPAYGNLDLKTQVENRAGCPVAVENDCNLGALAELSMSELDGEPLRDFVFIEIGDEGMGAGIVMNRELYRGRDSTLSAEVGHMIIDSSGPLCSCGRRGCWELYVCDRATWDRYSFGVKFTPQRFQRFIADVMSAHPRAMASAQETARYLSLGISNVSLLLNPSTIIIAGNVCNIWNSISRTVESAFASASVAVPIRAARLTPDQLFLRGAIHLALSRIFSAPRLGW